MGNMRRRRPVEVKRSLRRSARARRIDPMRNLPTCRYCGKIAYPSSYRAGLAVDRYHLAQVYRCGAGGIHVTSSPERPPRDDGRHNRKGSTVSTLKTCPVCAPGQREPCPHPMHLLGRDPDQPYYPDVVVPLLGADGNIFMAQGLVARHLRRAQVGAETIRAFGVDLRSSDSYTEALACVMRWVSVG